MVDQGENFQNPKRYRRLVEKLIYLTLTIMRPSISYAIGVVCQFMRIVV